MNVKIKLCYLKKKKKNHPHTRQKTTHHYIMNYIMKKLSKSILANEKPMISKFFLLKGSDYAVRKVRRRLPDFKK